MSWSRYCIISLVTLIEKNLHTIVVRVRGLQGEPRCGQESSLHPEVSPRCLGPRFSFFFFPSTLLLFTPPFLCWFISSFTSPCPRIALPHSPSHSSLPTPGPVQPHHSSELDLHPLSSLRLSWRPIWETASRECLPTPEKIPVTILYSRCSVFSWKTATQYMSFRI